jgi:hypothetical protein
MKHMLVIMLSIFIALIVLPDLSVGQNSVRIGILINEKSMLSMSDSIVAESFEDASYEAITVEIVEMYDTLGHHFLILYCRSTISGPVTVSFRLREEPENDRTYLALVDDQRGVRFFSTRRFVNNIRKRL